MEIHYEICKKLGLDPEKNLKRKIRGLPGFSTQELIFALIHTFSMGEAAEILGYSSSQAIKTACKDLLSPLFPKRTMLAASSWRAELLLIVDKKHCNSCKTIKPILEFRKHINRPDGLSGYCSKCMTADNKSYKIGIKLRTPPWADILKIKEFYSKCPPNMEVDHIIPLNGSKVSGLHVLNNLQYLFPLDNHTKTNKFIIP